MSAQSEIVYSLPGGGALLAPELAKQLDLEPQALQRWFEAASYGDQASKVGQGGRQAAWFVNGPLARLCCVTIAVVVWWPASMNRPTCGKGPRALAVGENFR